ncbi:hypothetical protein SNEBB_009211 [Seison nebaliae]|nr:hypothetical protein SNEBB_009211 [Seison nebaliae]
MNKKSIRPIKIGLSFDESTLTLIYHKQLTGQKRKRIIKFHSLKDANRCLKYLRNEQNVSYFQFFDDEKLLKYITILTEANFGQDWNLKKSQVQQKDQMFDIGSFQLEKNANVSQNNITDNEYDPICINYNNKLSKSTSGSHIKKDSIVMSSDDSTTSSSSASFTQSLSESLVQSSIIETNTTNKNDAKDEPDSSIKFSDYNDMGDSTIESSTSLSKATSKSSKNENQLNLGRDAMSYLPKLSMGPKKVKKENNDDSSKNSIDDFKFNSTFGKIKNSDDSSSDEFKYS